MAVSPRPWLVSPTSPARPTKRPGTGSEADTSRQAHGAPVRIVCQADAHPDNRTQPPYYLRARPGCAVQTTAPRAAVALIRRAKNDASRAPLRNNPERHTARELARRYSPSRFPALRRGAGKFVPTAGPRRTATTPTTTATVATRLGETVGLSGIHPYAFLHFPRADLTNSMMDCLTDSGRDSHAAPIS